ncbi:RNA 3'-terminal phosphate cyclase [Polyangium spumosum]|uniref:RNA 3'-terminal phosphate cyclase n=1 Tax=Polyangium spumosum TaxID=889282 RepID=A0A6N7PRU5_9BACT|nr:RNA 3'-terminal phosphate cyclase [Polyangium spumosum]MRG94357.1 RNA 3'-terminal phosphate cyclase [Polyangium spumosum]
MLVLDGSTGEGGGQILRSSLALSMVTGQAFRVHSIRAKRSKPGLMRQHLVAVRAAAEVSGAEVTGDAIGSRELVFKPGVVRHGSYRFAIGSAGSATLVLQTVLPALLVSEGSSSLVFEGGTHNPMAPPFDFVERAFLPIVRKMGAKVSARLVSYGFYPAGGGRVEVSIEGNTKLAGLSLLDRGEVQRTQLRAIVSQIPGSVGVREVEAFLAEVPWDPACARPEVVKNSPGPGNALVADVESNHVTEVFTAFGERGVRAEVVAEKLAKEVKRYLEAGVPVGEHLADQLLLPMALGQGGAFRTLAPSGHTRTQVEVIRTFLGTEVRLDERGAEECVIEVEGARR